MFDIPTVEVGAFLGLGRAEEFPDLQWDDPTAPVLIFEKLAIVVRRRDASKLRQQIRKLDN